MVFSFLPAAEAAQQFSCPQPPHTMILLRHAPRMNDTEDSPLSKKGWEEAGRLVSLLGDKPISTIYVSTKRRTQQTAMPLAAYLEIEPGVIEDTPVGTERLLAAVCRSRRADVVVYVGHTYTIDKIFAAFGLGAPAEGGEPVHEISFQTGTPKVSRIR